MKLYVASNEQQNFYVNLILFWVGRLLSAVYVKSGLDCMKCRGNKGGVFTVILLKAVTFRNVTPCCWVNVSGCYDIMQFSICKGSGVQEE